MQEHSLITIEVNTSTINLSPLYFDEYIAMDQIYTIGCSTHTIEGLLNILGNYNIDTIVDVRSIPFSRYTPQFNQDNLKKMLSSKRIHYLDFSEEFGARRKEKEVYSMVL